MAAGITDDVKTKLQELARQYADMVYAAAVRQLGGPDQSAEDVTQAVFLIALHKAKAGTLPEEDRMAGWLLRVTAYAVKDAWRRDDRRRRHEADAAGRRPETVQGPAEAEAEEVRKLLDLGLLDLGPLDREVLVRRYLRGQAMGEVAAAVRLSENTARQRINRALEKLRKILRKHGLTAPVAGVAAVMAAESAKAAPAAVAASAIGVVSGAGGGSAAAVSVAKGAAVMMKMAMLKMVAAGMVAAMVVVSLMVILGNQLLAAEKPAPVLVASTRDAAKPVSNAVPGTRGAAVVDAPALVREVQAKEKWIETASSFHVKATTTWTKSPKAIAQRREELEKDFQGVDEKRFPELLPKMTDTVELAFDQKRAFYRENRPAQMDDMRIWDGASGMAYYASHPSQHEQYVLQKDPAQLLMFAMSSFSWPRADAHRMWWEKQSQVTARNAESIDPADFAYVRTDTFRGIECYVLARGADQSRLRWYVGVQDHLLHKIESGTLPGNPAAFQVVAAEASNGGVTLQSEADAGAWMQALPVQSRDALMALALERMRATDKAGTEQWMLDDVELKPGCWFPKTQGYVVYGYTVKVGHSVMASDYEHPWESTHRDIQVTEVQLDGAPPNNLFVMPPIKEGAQVQDQTPGFLVDYHYKKDMPAAEWAKILEDAKQQKAKDEAGRSGG